MNGQTFWSFTFVIQYGTLLGLLVFSFFQCLNEIEEMPSGMCFPQGNHRRGMLRIVENRIEYLSLIKRHF
jgi:hypothetical protein